MRSSDILKIRRYKAQKKSLIGRNLFFRYGYPALFKKFPPIKFVYFALCLIAIHTHILL